MAALLVRPRAPAPRVFHVKHRGFADVGGLRDVRGGAAARRARDWPGRPRRVAGTMAAGEARRAGRAEGRTGGGPPLGCPCELVGPPDCSVGGLRGKSPREGPTARCRDEGERGKAFGRARCGPSGVLGLMGTRMGWAGMFHVKHRGFAERRAGCRGMAASAGSDQKRRGGEREQRGKDGGEPREAIGPGGHDGTRGGRGAADARGSVGGGSSGSAGAASGASRRRGRPRR